MATTDGPRRVSGSRSTLINALIGAVVAVVLSFIPFSPLLGGAVAGYLNAERGGDGLRVGALSGVITMIPLLVFGGLVVAVFGVGVGVFDPISGASVFVIFGAFLLVALLVGGLYTVGLGALGGYMGVELARREAQQAPGSTPLGGQSAESAPTEVRQHVGESPPEQSGQRTGDSPPTDAGQRTGESDEYAGGSVGHDADGTDDGTDGDGGHWRDHYDDDAEDDDRTGGQRGDT